MPAIRLPRLDRLSPADWLLLGEALAMLAWASAAIAMLPFRRVAAAASAPLPRAAAADRAAAARRIRWAVEAWARRVPWKAVCFQRGLAAHRMLRRRGIDSMLHYEIAKAESAKAESGGLSAHVWISLDGRTILGGEEAPKFTCVATFPDEAAAPPID